MTGPTGAALAPLRARYASWLGLDTEHVLADRDEEPDRIRALQIVLRLERDRTPSWHAALALAARGCAQLCLDPRAEPGGEWFDAVHDYCTGHIRKVTRRARGAHWQAAQELPGITLTSGDTQVRALVPGRASALDKRISRLQVGGTDAPIDDPSPAPGDGTLQMWLPPEPVMTLGKSMAQTGHAAMIAAALMAGTTPDALDRWAAAGYPCHGIRADELTWRRLADAVHHPAEAWDGDRLAAVRDAGFTEIAPGTITVIARAPH